MLILYGPYIGQLADAAIELVEARRKAGLFRRAFLIAPAARTLGLEQRYLQRLPEGSLMRAEILSFRRFALRMAEEAGLGLPPLWAAQSQVLLLRRILREGEADFPRLRRLLARPNYLENLRGELAALRAMGLGGENLAALLAEAGDSGAADLAKLRELALLEERVQARMRALGRRDGSADLDGLAGLLAEEEAARRGGAADTPLAALRDTLIFVNGFGESRPFSAQEYRVLRALEGLVGELVLSCAADACPARAEGVERGSLAWRRGRSVLYNLQKDFPAARVERVGAAPSPWARRVALCDEAAADPFAPSPMPGEGSGPDLSGSGALCPLIAAPDERRLLEKVLGYIQQQVLHAGWRYRDFALCVCKPGETEKLLAPLLEDMDIPAFFDARRSLAQSAVFGELAAFMRLALERFAREELFLLLRYAEAPQNWRQLDAFANFCLRLGLTQARLCQAERYRVAAAGAEGERHWAFARSRLLPLKALCERFYRARTMGEAQLALVDYLRLSGMEARIRERSAALMQENGAEAAKDLVQAWNALLALLADLQESFSGERCTAGEFFELLLRAAESHYLGAIPSLQDEVFVGTPFGSLSQRPRRLILLNPSAEAFPGAALRGGVLNDLDYRFLEGLVGKKLPLAPGDDPCADRFVMHQLLSASREAPLVALTERDAAPDVLLLRLMGLDSPRALHAALRSHSAAQEGLRLYQAKLRERLALARESGPNTAAALEALRVAPTRLPALPTQFSASSLERYAACPYSYLIEYVLAARERPELKLDAARAGELRHDLLEALFAELRAAFAGQTRPEDALWEDFFARSGERALAERLLSMKEEGRLSASYFEEGRYGATLRPLVQAVGDTARLVAEMQRADGFRPYAVEWAFGFDARPPFMLRAADGGSEPIALAGRIDRIDSLRDAAGPGYALSDYKSSLHKVSRRGIWEGLDLQLPVYMLAFLGLEKLPDAALREVYYMQIKRANGGQREKQGELRRKERVSRLRFDTAELRQILDRSRAQIERMVDALRGGAYPLRPRAVGEASACRFCAAAPSCPYDRPGDENERYAEIPESEWGEWLEERRAGAARVGRRGRGEDGR